MKGMSFGATIDGDIRQIMLREFQAGEKAVTTAMRIAGQAVKQAWRDDVTGAGLGTKLANTIRADTYPKGTDSANAASLIWTKAPKLIGAHEAGPLIRARDGFWLAIPTKAAGLGSYRRKMTPALWQQRHGTKLRFVSPHRGTYLLVADGQRRTSAGGTVRQRGRRNPGQSVVIFILVPQVKLPKRLNLDAATQRGAGGLASSIVTNWK